MAGDAKPSQMYGNAKRVAAAFTGGVVLVLAVVALTLFARGEATHARRVPVITPHPSAPSSRVDSAEDTTTRPLAVSLQLALQEVRRQRRGTDIDLTEAIVPEVPQEVQDERDQAAQAAAQQGVLERAAAHASDNMDHVPDEAGAEAFFKDAGAQQVNEQAKADVRATKALKDARATIDADHDARQAALAFQRNQAIQRRSLRDGSIGSDVVKEAEEKSKVERAAAAARAANATDKSASRSAQLPMEGALDAHAWPIRGQDPAWAKSSHEPPTTPATSHEPPTTPSTPSTPSSPSAPSPPPAPAATPALAPASAPEATPAATSAVAKATKQLDAAIDKELAKPIDKASVLISEEAAAAAAGRHGITRLMSEDQSLVRAPLLSTEAVEAQAASVAHDSYLHPTASKKAKVAAQRKTAHRPKKGSQDGFMQEPTEFGPWLLN